MIDYSKKTIYKLVLFSFLFVVFLFFTKKETFSLDNFLTTFVVSFFIIYLTDTIINSLLPSRKQITKKEIKDISVEKPKTERKKIEDNDSPKIKRLSYTKR